MNKGLLISAKESMASAEDALSGAEKSTGVTQLARLWKAIAGLEFAAKRLRNIAEDLEGGES